MVLSEQDDFYVKYSSEVVLKFKDSVSNTRRPCHVETELVPIYSKKTGSTKVNFGADAARVYTDENAGGSSEFSEALSMEILQRLFHFKLERTEMAIRYCHSGSKKTDYTVRTDANQILGVSVTRAMHYFDNKLFKAEQAKLLLKKKLNGILCSTANVAPECRWKKQLLHVFAPSKKIAKLMRAEYKKLSSTLKANTVVFVTVVTCPQVAQFVFQQKQHQ